MLIKCLAAFYYKFMIVIILKDFQKQKETKKNQFWKIPVLEHQTNKQTEYSCCLKPFFPSPIYVKLSIPKQMFLWKIFFGLFVCLLFDWRTKQKNKTNEMLSSMFENWIFFLARARISSIHRMFFTKQPTNQTNKKQQKSNLQSVRFNLFPVFCLFVSENVKRNKQTNTSSSYVKHILIGIKFFFRLFDQKILAISPLVVVVVVAIVTQTNMCKPSMSA